MSHRAAPTIWPRADATPGRSRFLDAVPVERSPRVRWSTDLDPGWRSQWKILSGSRHWDPPKNWSRPSAWIVATPTRVLVPLAERVIVLDADRGGKLDELSAPAASSPVISFEGDVLGWERIEPFKRSVTDALGTIEQDPGELRVLDGDGRTRWNAIGYCRVGALAPDIVAMLDLRPAMHSDYDELQLRSRRDGSVIASLGPTWPEVAIARDVIYHCPLGEGGVAAWRLDGTRLWALSGPQVNMPPNCDATMAAIDERVFLISPAMRSVVCLEPG